MSAAETFLDPLVSTANEKVAAIEKSISQYAKDSNLTPAEQRTLAQTLVYYLDVTLEGISRETLSVSKIAEASKNLIEYVLKGALESRNYGRELGQEFSARIAQENRVQDFLGQTGGVAGMAFGLGLSVAGKGKGGESKTEMAGQKAKPSIKSKIKEQQLPTQGKIRFVPKKGDGNLVRGQEHGFVDKFDNEWKKGPSRTQGEPFEWDVQLSPKGQAQLGWASRDGKHLNVSIKGRITHK